jgi:hypothetical protein
MLVCLSAVLTHPGGFAPAVLCVCSGGHTAWSTCDADGDAENLNLTGANKLRDVGADGG